MARQSGSAELTGRRACWGGGWWPPADTRLCPAPTSSPDRLGRPLRKRSKSAAARGAEEHSREGRADASEGRVPFPGDGRPESRDA